MEFLRKCIKSHDCVTAHFKNDIVHYTDSFVPTVNMFAADTKMCYVLCIFNVDK